jgi:hypothetical protein
MRHHKTTEFRGTILGDFFEEPITTSAGTERRVKISLIDLLPDDCKFRMGESTIKVEITVISEGDDR